ncbi:multidrug effflux MFS transporter [Celeribacter sp.]|uniref:multidrug effflux MFS transporter n=1 Tax=Celeribacter sp. TaxID=1890673 RepID=UPI003A8FBC0D
MPRRLSQPEFIALLALLSATVAFSMDSMLPALPEIAQTLSPDAPNRAQLILTSFMFGLGLGTLLAGPLSDAFGRRTVIVGGLALYAVAAILTMTVQSLDSLVALRVIQGLGAAAPRVVSTAMVRDLYQGREMARLQSFVMMIFILVPAVAPAIGAVIISGFGWRGVFGSFAVFAAISTFWLMSRQEETLPRENRRPLSISKLIAGTRETLSNASVRIYIAALTLGFGQMFGLLSSIQQIYGEIFDRADSFPMWFALQALISGFGTFFNARFVVTLGMRRIALSAYATQIAISSIVLVITLSGLLPDGLAFPVFFFWSVSVFFMAGVTFGNLISLALEPLGHLAGLGASVTQGIATVLAVLIAAPIGLAFNGTLVPILIGTLLCSGGAFLLLRRTIDTPAPAE